MTFKTFTRGHRSKPWSVAAEKGLLGLCGAVICFRGCPQYLEDVHRMSVESRMQETQKTFPRHFQQAGKTGWALQVPHWTQHGSWGFESESLPSLWHKAALSSDGQIISLPPPEAHQTWAEAPAAYFAALKWEHSCFPLQQSSLLSTSWHQTPQLGSSLERRRKCDQKVWERQK